MTFPRGSAVTIWGLLLLACISASSPAFAQPRTQYQPRIDAALAPKTESGLIASLDARPERNFVVLGRFAAMGSGDSGEQLLMAAKEKAAQLGADFIWVVKTDEATRSRFERPTAGLELGRKRPAPRIGTSSSSALYAVIGVYTRAAIGLIYEDRTANPGHLIIRDFRAGSNAPAAGVRAGDELVEIDGFGVNDGKFESAALTMRPGQAVKLLLKRGEETLAVEVALIPND
jgi:PDZ domain